MKENKQKWKWFFCIATALCMILFILGNALLDYRLSHAFSGFFVRLFGLTVGNGVQETDLVLRKIAHMIEYALLGISVIPLSIKINSRFKKSIIGFSFFFVLAVAVLDEHIQSFSDRSSSTSDIILDFFGALFGFLMGWLMIKVYEKIKQHYKKKIDMEVA